MSKAKKTPTALVDQEKALEHIYTLVASLNFRSLLLLQTQLAEHIWNCWAHHEQQKVSAQPSALAEETDPKPQARPFDA